MATFFKATILIVFMGMAPMVSVSAQYRVPYKEMGRRALWNKDYTEALGFFNAMVSQYPNQHDGYYFRALTKYYLDDLIGAEADISRAIQIIPSGMDMFLLRGVIRSDRLNYRGALSDFAKAIEIDSNYFDAYYYRSITYIDLRQYTEALADCYRVIEHNNDYENIHIVLAHIEAQLGNHTEALAALNKALNKQPKNKVLTLQRAGIYLQLDMADSALIDLNHFIASDTSNAYAYFQRGQAYIQLSEYDSAIADLNRVLEFNPDNELASFNRALLRAEKDQTSDALTDFGNILRKNPDNMLVYYNLGVTMQKIGDFKKALVCYDKAIELYPEYYEAYQRRSQVKQRLGDLAGAIDDQAKAKAITENSKAKNDSAKFEEGLKLMELTHLTSDFASQAEQKKKVQYRDIVVVLKPIFTLSIHPERDSNLYAYDSRGKGNYGMRIIPIVHEISTDTDQINNLRQSELSLKQLKSPTEQELLKRGLLNMQTGNYFDAMAIFDTLLARNPKQILATYSKANAMLLFLEKNDVREQTHQNHYEASLLAYKNNLGTVIDMYNEVLTYDPDFMYAAYNRGYAKFILEDFNGALSDFLLVSGKLDLAAAYYNTGLLSILGNNKQIGCEALSKAGELGLFDAYSIMKQYCSR